MKKIFSLFAVIASLVVLTACGNKNVLVVGLEAAYAPFNWSTSTKSEFTHELDGQPGIYVDGFDVQMAKSIAESLNKTLVIKAIDWEGLIPALNSGQIDLIIAGMSPTDERKENINFTDVYYRSEVVMVVHKDSTYVDATSISEFSGARAIAQTGTIYDDLIAQIPNVVHQESLSSYTALMQAVVARTADVLVAELPVAQSLTSKNANLKMVRLTNGSFETLDEDVTVAIGLRKKDTALLEEINEALSKISIETRNAWMEAALERQ
ncbi:transporter substrate-binding domain-containing protein [Haploplasma axanthum]|uniref:Arginine-binding extracellular protein ArtP n=1 Tax=Haploplasma axanthum TaxID=29552 RepID=A0A449BC81_HAPAX|nr:transporter substrate-binding domain-containing protein [Haploplasma axanthum]VEU80046.1 Arginine-binding extracellular protein ArtP precursor [Haploplasma axanthum]